MPGLAPTTRAGVDGRRRVGHASPAPQTAPNTAPMKITFKLFASLTDYLPPAVRALNAMEIEVPAGATVMQVIEPFALPPSMVHLVLVNGRYLAPPERSTQPLNDGDVLAIWPPIAGG